MTAAWLAAFGGFVVRVLGKTNDSTGSKVAMANLARHLAKKAKAGDLTDIAIATQDHHERRMNAQTTGLQGDAAQKIAQAFKTTMEGVEIANRVATNPDSVPAARAAAQKALDAALASLSMHGGGMLVDSTKVQQLANSATIAGGNTDLDIALRGIGTVSATLEVAIDNTSGVSKAATVPVEGVGDSSAAAAASPTGEAATREASLEVSAHLVQEATPKDRPADQSGGFGDAAFGETTFGGG